MNVFIIISLVCLVAVGWFWFWLKKPVLKRAPARTWLAPRGKTEFKPKRKFVVPF